jgi:hypothetical protein
MKLLGLISTAVLSLTLGATALAYPQQEQREQEQKDKPAQENEKKAQPEKPAKQPAKQAEKAAPKPNQNAKPEAAHQQPARTRQAQPKPQAQHAGAGARGGRIPDDRYKANFGRQHTFRVSQGDYGNRRFQYGGYWFGFAGVWPSNWLYTQDVYVVDINGVYYLCNPNYPGVNVELNVTL